MRRGERGQRVHRISSARATGGTAMKNRRRNSAVNGEILFALVRIRSIFHQSSLAESLESFTSKFDESWQGSSENGSPRNRCDRNASGGNRAAQQVSPVNTESVEPFLSIVRLLLRTDCFAGCIYTSASVCELAINNVTSLHQICVSVMSRVCVRRLLLWFMCMHFRICGRRELVNERSL